MPLRDLALGPLVLEAIDGGWSGSPVVPSTRLASESRGTFLASPSKGRFCSRSTHVMSPSVSLAGCRPSGQVRVWDRERKGCGLWRLSSVCVLGSRHDKSANKIRIKNRIQIKLQIKLQIKNKIKIKIIRKRYLN